MKKEQLPIIKNTLRVIIGINKGYFQEGGFDIIIDIRSPLGYFKP